MSAFFAQWCNWHLPPRKRKPKAAKPQIVCQWGKLLRQHGRIHATAYSEASPLQSPRDWVKTTAVALLCPFPSSEMKNPEDFFFHIREKCFQGRDFAPEGWLYCCERSEGCNRNPRSKVPPEDTLLSEMEQKSKGLFFISDVGWDYLLFYTEFLQRLSVLNCGLYSLCSL